MQLRLIDEEYAAFLTPPDVELLSDHAKERAHSLEISFLYWSLARSSEAANATGADVFKHNGRPMVVLKLKDTDPAEDNPLYDTRLLPEHLYDELRQWCSEQNRTGDSDLFGVQAGTIQNHVKRAAENVAEETGDDRWLKVSSHDLRRSAANHLYNAGLDKELVAQHGGWRNVRSISPYIKPATRDRLESKLERVGWFGDAPVTDRDRLLALSQAVEQNHRILLQLCERLGVEPDTQTSVEDLLEGMERKNADLSRF